MSRGLAIRATAFAGLIALALSVVPAVPATSAFATEIPPSGASAQASSGDETPPENGTPDIPESERDARLGEDWEAGTDLAWQITGDASGLRVLVAHEREGYAWSEKVNLAISGVETDRWIGNACLATGTNRLAVTYAPRGFTNEPAMFMHGAFAAIVDLETGAVDEIGGGFSLSHFSPGCGADGWVTFARYAEDGRVRFESVKADDAARTRSIDAVGQLTSPVETRDGLVAAAGSSLVSINEEGTVSKLAELEGVASRITPVNDGVLLLERKEEETSVTWVDLAPEEPTAQEVVSADIGDIGLAVDGAGTAHVVGDIAAGATLPKGVVESSELPVGAVLSREGTLATDSPLIPASESGQAVPYADMTGIVVGSSEGDEVAFKVPLVGGDRSESVGVGDNATGAARQSAEGLNSVVQDPWTSGSLCAVPRNWSKNQALQPRPVQAQWAANRAVRGLLTETRPANWMNLDLPSYSPQGLFPRVGLTAPSSGRVPTQVLLGVLAQESNLRQASSYTVPGVTGNPLIGNYYGINRASTDADAWWQIDYSKVDCGYGIGQVTDGMEYGEMDNWKQRVIALDYEANIARSLQILESKWNETRAQGLIINDGDSAFLENWYFALWAYNSGFKPPSGAGQPWGVGWLNNPANPLYDTNRTSFLDGNPGDAAHPQDWPYQEKVLGFAAHSVQLLDSVSSGPLGDTFTDGPAFTPAWFASSDGQNGELNQQRVQPPWSLFCKASNKCDPSVYLELPGQDPGPCYSVDADLKPDFKCWYHEAAQWKTDCPGQCGHETYLSTTSPKPADAASFLPNCSTADLPSGALIIDNVPNGTPVVRPGCSPVSTTGSFELSFADIGTGNYPAKVDLHQLGSGFNGQFYFTHTRVPGTDPAFNGELDITGKWSLGQALNSWARVYVHMPNHGAWLQQAEYKINTGLTTVTRSVNQRTYANSWVSLGTLQFAGQPTIELSNTPNSLDPLSGIDDIAWDAVAFVPLSAKPAEFVVALGDSYSSGEGTSPTDGSGFFRSSDNNGQSQWHNNGCHRSAEAWPFKIDLPGLPGAETIRQLNESKDARLDFQFLACSGAETYHVDGINPPDDPDIPGGARGRFDELPQIQRGFLDANTTLVTLSIGGNDLGFSPILQHCVLNAPSITPCRDSGTIDDWPGATAGAAVDARLAGLASQVGETLAKIHLEAPNAKILMLGYPMLFESGGACAGILERDRPWLNEMAAGLNAALTKAAAAAGVYVTYADPQYQFAGHNLCTDLPGITPLIFDLTPGDRPMFYVPVPGGPNVPKGISSQSVHPTSYGTGLYAQVANNALRSVRVPLTAGIAGGAPTTYYATFRLHDGGPALMNATSFSSCGEELRIGLRRSPDGVQQVTGQQHTQTLSWTKTNVMQTFRNSDTIPSTPYLVAGFYAVNARLTATCASGSNQSWAASLYW